MDIPNLSEVEAWKPRGGLPYGAHTCQIDVVKEGRSAGGHPELEVHFVATRGDHTGGRITDWITITPESLGRVRMFLEAAGHPIDSGKIDSGLLRGREIEVVVGPHETPAGSTVPRVKGYREAVPF